MQELTIRTIRPGDDQPLARIIRGTLEEFKANKPGTVYFDDTTDHLSDVLKLPGVSISLWNRVEQLWVAGASIQPQTWRKAPVSW